MRHRISQLHNFIGWLSRRRATKRRVAAFFDELSRRRMNERISSNDPALRDIPVTEVLHAIQTSMKWPNDHFRPDDRLRILLTGASDGIDMISSLAKIRRLFGFSFTGAHWDEVLDLGLKDALIRLREIKAREIRRD